MQVAIDTRTVDKDQLLRICVGRIACSLATRVLWALDSRHITRPLQIRIRRLYDVRLFRARARLDLPTYEATSVQRQLDAASSEIAGRSVAFETLAMGLTLLRASVQLFAQVFVLVRVLHAQRDGILLAGLTLSSQSIQWLSTMQRYDGARGM